MVGCGDFDSRGDERAQGRDAAGNTLGCLERREQSLTWRQVGAVEHMWHGVGVKLPQVFDNDAILAPEVLVCGAPGHVRQLAELVDSGVADALFAEQVLRCVENSLSRAPAATLASRTLSR